MYVLNGITTLGRLRESADSTKLPNVGFHENERVAFDATKFRERASPWVVNCACGGVPRRASTRSTEKTKVQGTKKVAFFHPFISPVGMHQTACSALGLITLRSGEAPRRGIWRFIYQPRAKPYRHVMHPARALLARYIEVRVNPLFLDDPIDHSITQTTSHKTHNHN